MLLEKKFDEKENCWDIELYGDIDLYNAPKLKAGLEEASGADIVLNCKHLKYIDSTGLGVLVSMLNECKKQSHSVRITGLKPHIYRIFELTNLHTVFDIEVSE